MCNNLRKQDQFLYKINLPENVISEYYDIFSKTSSIYSNLMSYIFQRINAKRKWTHYNNRIVSICH